MWRVVMSRSHRTDAPLPLSCMFSLPLPPMQPPLSSVLGPHIASGAVDYHWFEGVPPPPPASPPEGVAEQLGAGADAPIPRELQIGFNYSGKRQLGSEQMRAAAGGVLVCLCLAQEAQSAQLACRERALHMRAGFPQPWGLL